MIKPNAIISVIVSIITLVFIPGCQSKTPDLTLSGTVTDAVSGRPIPGAYVSDGSYGPPPVKGALTDSSGRYRYATWAEEHTITVKAPGFKILTGNLNPRPNDTQKDMDFKLDRE